MSGTKNETIKALRDEVERLKYLIDTERLIISNALRIEPYTHARTASDRINDLMSKELVKDMLADRVRIKVIKEIDAASNDAFSKTCENGTTAV